MDSTFIINLFIHCIIRYSFSMKVLSISDIVVPELTGYFDKTPFAGTELVLSCGDLPPEYIASIAQRLDVPLFYIRGNHDIRYRTSPPMGCLNLHLRFERYNGIRFAGFEGSRWYNGGPIQYREAQMRRHTRKIWPKLLWNRGVDVVMTHAPPRHIHDAEDRCHRGFKTFRKVMAKYQPRYLIHGHIHRSFTNPAERITRHGKTNIVNTCGYWQFTIEPA